LRGESMGMSKTARYRSALVAQLNTSGEFT
jgi:hypothetical protein